MASMRAILAMIVSIGLAMTAAQPGTAQPARQPSRPTSPAPVTPPPVTPAPPAATSPTESSGPQQVIVVGIIDIGAVLRDSSAAQRLQEQMEAEQGKLQTAFDKAQRELRQAEEELERERGSLPADAYAEKRRAFQQRLEKAGNDFRLHRRQLEQAFGTAYATIMQTLSVAVEEVASENGLTIILRREAVLFQKDAIDVTQAAIARLNDKLPTVDLKLPPAGQ